jgi:hypothetical protein
MYVCMEELPKKLVSDLILSPRDFHLRGPIGNGYQNAFWLSCIISSITLLTEISLRFFLPRSSLRHVVRAVCAHHLHQHDAAEGDRVEGSVPSVYVRRARCSAENLPGAGVPLRTSHVVRETDIPHDGG